MIDREEEPTIARRDGERVGEVVPLRHHAEGRRQVHGERQGDPVLWTRVALETPDVFAQVQIGVQRTEILRDVRDEQGIVRAQVPLAAKTLGYSLSPRETRMG
jgi:hypothetical protein